ncbi:uncharacterized protein LOC100903985 [Galendromus occidentalis]|uniref:Uncharacterized protein LOC100903985 n=1 Tax=Galendromus occidentalis TaxID=34638 RepID=A0AAJ6QTD9_9ACAR|nr:uncharacterized protein LOC100903985 [Galendromus occidentalis]
MGVHGSARALETNNDPRVIPPKNHAIWKNVDTLTASDEDSGCRPGKVSVRIPVEIQEDIMISWEVAPCDVSGYLLELTEADGLGSNLTSGLCKETQIHLKRDVARFFSRFFVSIYAANITRNGAVMKSTPSVQEFAVCPSRKPETPTDVNIDVYADSKVKFTWRSTETLWQIQGFTLLYCEGTTNCKRRTIPFSATGMSYEMFLWDKKYTVELFPVCDTEECGIARGRAYRSVLYEDLASASSSIVRISQCAVFCDCVSKYLHRQQRNDERRESRHDLEDVCNAQGDCSLVLEKLIRLDTKYEFGISARSHDSVTYYSDLSDGEKCILETRALTHTEVAILDRTQNFSSMIESVDTERVIVIDQNIFSLTDGTVVSSMIFVGDPDELRKPLGENVPFKKALNGRGKLLPTRITSPEWNVYSAWNNAESHIDDPALHCRWMWGAPSNYIVCALGVEKCSDSVVKACNGPLLPHTEYGLKMRGCTTLGCTDTDMFRFKTGIGVLPDDPSGTDPRLGILLAFIGCIIGGGLIIVLLSLIILRWTEMREMHREQRFRLVEF